MFPTHTVASLTGLVLLRALMGTLAYWVLLMERFIGPVALLVAMAIMANAL